MSGVLLLVNPQAAGGRSRPTAHRVADALRTRGWDLSVRETDSGEHATALAAAATPSDLVVALGGDGFVGLVAGGCVTSGAALAPLPGGRGNDFCRALGVPADPVAAALALPVTRERQIEVAEVVADGAERGRIVLGIAGMGFESEATRIANETTWLRGPAVYAYGAVRTMLTFRLPQLRLTVDGADLTLAAWNAAVGVSGRYGGGMLMCPHAELDDGLLDLVVIGDVPRRSFGAILARVFKGSHVAHPQVIERRARTVRLDADRPFMVFGDGDPICQTPVTVHVRPAALRVLA